MRKVTLGAILIVGLFAPATAWAARASIVGGAPEMITYGIVPVQKSNSTLLTTCSGFAVSRHVVLTARHCGNVQFAGWGGSGSITTYNAGRVRRIVHAPGGADLEAVWTRHAYGSHVSTSFRWPYVGQLLNMDGFGLTNPSDPNSWGILTNAFVVAYKCRAGAWDGFCVYPGGPAPFGGISSDGDSGGPVFNVGGRVLGMIDKGDSQYVTVVISLAPFRAWVLAQERAAG
jgi:hypothetical protein